MLSTRIALWALSQTRFAAHSGSASGSTALNPGAEHRRFSCLRRRSSSGEGKAQVALWRLCLLRGCGEHPVCCCASESLWMALQQRAVAEARNCSGLIVVPCWWWRLSSTFNMQCTENKSGIISFQLQSFILCLFILQCATVHTLPGM